jgi:competence protein ComFC
MSIVSFVASLFTQNKCYSCGQEWHFFCQRCLQSISFYEPYCYICKKSSKDFKIHTQCSVDFYLKQVIVFTRYRQNTVKHALKHAKYYGKYKIYDDFFSQVWDFPRNTLLSLEKGILVPVPMHFLRRWKRWYNQAHKIAQVFSQINWFPIDEKLIKRSRYTKHQSHLSQAQRHKNLKNSFHVLKNTYPRDQIIYLIDDVVSTWSTLQEIASTLQAAWFQDIRAIVIASD